MANRMVGTMVSGVVCGVALLGAGGIGWGQGSKDPYPVMAPVEQYRVASAAEEVALARSAAPEAVSRDAEVLVLGERGYETAAKGTNGFVCLVERSWSDPFDDPEFWNPKARSPQCLNAAAARSVLPVYLKRTEWVLAGATKDQIQERTKEAVAKKVIAVPELGSMCYMLSKQGHLNDKDGHWHPHLMFFLPPTEPANWGANLKDSPIFAAQSNPEPIVTFFVPVEKWSDGTMAEMK
jgi:hypothetical protein